MKNTVILLLIFIVNASCKQKETQQPLDKELSIAEKIATAHGVNNWKNVSQIEFTFNVDRDSSHFERSWIWKPKTNDVTLITGNDSIIFNRKSVDSTSLSADKGFINDKYWLLAPFQLIWDKGITISEQVIAEAPLSKTKVNKITLAYSNEGGYTPGDAYDFYYTDDYLIKEWVFRKGNSKEPTLTTTWEDYQTINGIKLAKKHKKLNENWTLYFTNLVIK